MHKPFFMTMTDQTIHLHRNAPRKPAADAPCNGCGVCCAAEPCPVGSLRFLRRRGPCPALEWHGDLYRCGLLARPRHYLQWLPRRWEGTAHRLLRRWIASGLGCDSSAVIGD